LPILGGGPFRLKPGQVTDDTELAMALARSLLQRKTYDQSAVAAAYKFWLDSGPFDVGRTTQNALQLPANIGDDVLSAMLKQSEDRNGASLSNGCLMRISPLAIAGTNWTIEDLTSCAKADTRLTNPHLDAQIATAAFAAAIAELIRSGDEKKAFDMAREIAKESSLITDLLNAAEANAIPVKLSDGNEAKSDTTHMGYLGIALQWAFAEMLHAESFETGLVRVIFRGGDTDTNGCICGAMLGARFGVDAIPNDWRQTVTACQQKRVKTYPWVDSKDLQDVARQLVETVKTPDADQPKRNKGML